MDGTRFKTGFQNGVIRKTKVEKGLAVQLIICLLHLNELPLRHLFCHLEGVTSRSDSFKGDLGKKLLKYVWKDKKVSFSIVKGKLPYISEEQLNNTNNTSRNQKVL